MVLLYGRHACQAALKNEKRVIKNVWCTRSFWEKLTEDNSQGRSTFLEHNQPIFVGKAFLDALCPEVHQGIVIKAEPLSTSSFGSLEDSQKNVHRTLLVLDQVNDPQNIGSLLRLCWAFDASVLLTKAHAPAETGAMAKVASGALDAVPRFLVPNLAEAVRKLKKWGFWIVGLSEKADQPLASIDIQGKVALILGNEGFGLRALTRKLCDFEAFLPTSAAFSTLNVTMSAAIALAEIFQKKQRRSQNEE
jgi:23S rRNA (guanosine2251-2'-O)-methyltransferase